MLNGNDILFRQTATQTGTLVFTLQCRCILFTILTSFLCSASLEAQYTIGLIKADPAATFSYTLLAPLNSKNIYLIDNCGSVVHSWETDHLPGFATTLLPNGDILRNIRTGNSPILNGVGGGVERRSWDNQLIWRYVIADSNALMHHSVEVLPNGNLLIMVAERIPMTAAHAAGRDENRLRADFWVDAIYEVRPIGTDGAEIVWRWSTWDHTIQDRSDTIPNYGVVAEHPERVNINYYTTAPNVLYRDWTHFNNLSYNEQLDQILVCVRNFNEVWIIDHSTTTQQAAGSVGGRYNRGGDLLYRWGNPSAYDRGGSEAIQLYAPHDAHWIPQGLPFSGSILLFNNGVERKPTVYSTVDIIEPPQTPTGDYHRSQDASYGPETFKLSFAGSAGDTLRSNYYSSAAFMPNGNIFVTEGTTGRLTEFSPDGTVLWRYICPVGNNGPLEQGRPPSQNSVYSAQRIPSDHPALSHRKLAPLGPIELYPVPNNCNMSWWITNADDVQLGSQATTVQPSVAESTLYVHGSSQGDIYKVYSLAGKLELHGEIRSNPHEIDLSAIHSGVYILVLSNNTALTFVKLK